MLAKTYINNAAVFNDYIICISFYIFIIILKHK